jgi:hypothetical protein
VLEWTLCVVYVVEWTLCLVYVEAVVEWALFLVYLEACTVIDWTLYLLYVEAVAEWARCPVGDSSILPGSLLLRVLKSKIIVQLTYVYKNNVNLINV